jgi:hypothetical protein
MGGFNVTLDLHHKKAQSVSLQYEVVTAHMHCAVTEHFPVLHTVHVCPALLLNICISQNMHTCAALFLSSPVAQKGSPQFYLMFLI